MARFPSREAEITAAAVKLIEGLTDNPEIFPSPSVPPDELAVTLQRYRDAAEAAAKATAAARDAYSLKDDALEDLTDQMRSDYKYAESVAGRDEGKLLLVGWAARASRNRLQPPAQARDLEVVRSGKGWISLDWRQAPDGGEVAAYEVQVSRPEEGLWQNVGTALDTELLLSNQERGVELEYHVVAVNRAGKANPSNAVRVTL